MITDRSSNNSLKKNNNLKKMALLLLPVFALWLMVYWQALISAVRVWYVSEIYTHCFFVLPVSLFLIWRSRNHIFSVTPKPNYWVLLPLATISFIGMLGYAGDINVLSHIAAFSSLSLSIWLMLGNKIAKMIWFPLLFVLFAVPVGDELTPYLQEITATLAAPLIKLSGVPYHRNGLFIEIPEGRFVVAEACSGIRFFIVSIVFGAIYAHLSYASRSKQAFFMLLAILVPVFANAVRVYGIIMIGHWSDMKYAVGADHLVYGWFFFSIVLLVLYLLGERMRSAHDIKTLEPLFTRSSGYSRPDLLPVKPMFLLSALFITLFGWQQFLEVSLQRAVKVDVSSVEAISYRPISQADNHSWQPLFNQATQVFHIELNEGMVARPELYFAWYDGIDKQAELVSSANRLYQADQWSLLGREAVIIDNGHTEIPAELVTISSDIGRKRVILYWYQINRLGTANRVVVKLYQTLRKLQGRPPGGLFLAFSSELGENEVVVKQELLTIAKKYASTFGNLVDWN